MAEPEKKVYLESMAREMSRIQHHNIPDIVKQLQEMHEEINE